MASNGAFADFEATGADLAVAPSEAPSTAAARASTSLALPMTSVLTGPRARHAATGSR